MIQARSVYRHRTRYDFVRTCHIVTVDDLVVCYALTRDLNVPSGYVQEAHAPLLRIPRATFEQEWEFLKELK
jgi:hypothetical protein